MYSIRKPLLLLLPLLACALTANAQVTSCASFLKASPRCNVVVPFRYDDPGKQTPLWWGMDMAWISEDNLRTGIFFAGQDVIDYVRLSYQALASVEGGQFSSDQLSALNSRATPVLTWCKSDIGYYLEDDNAKDAQDSWYHDETVSSYERALRWAKVIDMTVDYYASRGLTNPVAIGPFNEPDYASQAVDTQNDLVSICSVLRNEEAYKDKYANVRLYGPSTLNPDYGVSWWSTMGGSFDEGNTHQLAGTFDSYASFFQTVTGEGKKACGDELHNIMEAMVGAEYGMQTGIWWGTAEYTRSQFMKATTHTNPGSRLAYAEHRGNWTAASVYRHAGGQVQAFLSESERQATTTYFDVFSLDRPVWYEGVRGREYFMEMRGGSGYMTEDQPYIEACVNIDGGADVRPAINGIYKVVNVGTGMLLGTSTNAKSGYVTVSQRQNSNTYKYLQWVVTPLHNTGDFSYYSFTLNNDAGMQLDVLNYGYEDGTDVGVYPGSLGANEQWYLEYAGQGAYYIRCRSAAKCLEVAGTKATVGANIRIADFTGEANQQWRFVATDVTPDFEAPSAPSGLRTTLQSASISLTWTPSESSDVMEYAVVRNGSLLARGLTTCSFTDNEAEQDSSYTYYVYAIDKSLNYSEPSNSVSGNTITDEKDTVMCLPLTESLYDVTPNGNHAALSGEASYVTNSNKTGISLTGADTCFIQLPYTIANHDALTVACWFRYSGGSTWQRIFDFGNGTDQYLFLTTNCGSGPRFAIKNGGDEETVDASTMLTSLKWYHLAVTIEKGKACLYIDGQLVGENDNMSILPSDIRPVLNYIGRSQYEADPCLKGYVSNFMVFNYALTSDEIDSVMTAVEGVPAEKGRGSEGTLGESYNLSGRRAASGEKGVIIRDGKKVLVR